MDKKKSQIEHNAGIQLHWTWKLFDRIINHFSRIIIIISFHRSCTFLHIFIFYFFTNSLNRIHPFIILLQCVVLKQICAGKFAKCIAHAATATPNWLQTEIFFLIQHILFSLHFFSVFLFIPLGHPSLRCIVSSTSPLIQYFPYCLMIARTFDAKFCPLHTIINLLPPLLLLRLQQLSC